MKYDNLIDRAFIPTFPSNIDHFVVRGYDEERKMILTTVIPKSGHSFEDEIEERYFIGAFETGDYKWAFPHEGDETLFITNPYGDLMNQLYPGMKLRTTRYSGPCCKRCKLRHGNSEFCDAHYKDEKCYRFKFDKNA